MQGKIHYIGWGKTLLTRSPGQEVVPVYETVRLHVH